MLQVQKCIPPVAPKNVQVVLESSILPNLKKSEDVLHKFAPKTPVTVITPKPAVQQPVEHVLDYFG